MSEIEKRLSDAHAVVCALCRPRGSEGAREWVMSIPADPERDPDLIIGSAIRAAEAEIADLRAQLAEAVGLLGPFAEEASHWATYSDRSSYGSNKVLYIIDLRRAREFIERVGK